MNLKAQTAGFYTPPKNLVLLCLVFLLAVSSIGCKSTEYWSFAVTGYAFEEKVFSSSTGGHILLLPLLVVLVGLDIVFLPVAIPHDIWLHVQRGRTEPAP